MKKENDADNLLKLTAKKKAKNNPFHTKLRYLIRRGFHFSLLSKGCFPNFKREINFFHFSIADDFYLILF